MKRFVFLIIIFFCTTQAQDIQGWIYFGYATKEGIRKSDLTNKAMLVIRCNRDDFDIFVNGDGNKLDDLKFLFGKIDSENIISGYEKSNDGIAVFLDNYSALHLVKSFLFAHYFSVALQYENRIQSYMFDLNGYGQAVKQLPCVIKYLNP
jgi:hypothetical protein